MDNLKKMSQRVKELLINEPATRNSDTYLYLRIAQEISKEHGVDAVAMPFGTVLMQLKELGLPQFETIRRARQKVQHDCPDLAGADRVEACRRVNEETYRQWSRQVIE